MRVMPHAILADAVLLIHFGVVVFVIGGLIVLPIGARHGWQWVRSRAFRFTHLAAIGVIALQAWLGQHCPLTHLETWLRLQAGQSTGYQISFVQHWVAKLMYYEAPLWVFAIAYTVFGLLVVGAWWRYPPRHRSAVKGNTRCQLSSRYD